MRSFYLATLWLLCSHLTIAQDIIPLTSNPVLERQQALWAQQLPEHLRPPSGKVALEKSACDLEQPGLAYLEAGRLLTYLLELDTAGAGFAPGVFNCANCGSLSFGTGTLSGDTLSYTANGTVVTGLEEIYLRYCNSDLSNCFVADTLRIQVKRRGQVRTQATTTIDAEDVVTLTANAALLPGTLACSRLLDCPSNYDGRTQISYFTDYSGPDNRVVYASSRFAGLDLVCVELCDSFTVCDTFNFPVRIRKDTLSLPFLDDFSYTGSDTDFDRWLDRDVFINTTMAVNPPSIGVATFDGLDEKGRPYGGGYGRADRLTSAYINLAAQGGDVNLTYWLQPRGLMDRPEERDSMVLEFRKLNGDWEQVMSHRGQPASQPNTVFDPFKPYLVPVPQEYRYGAFQFRFTNFSDRLGITDIWHLDYVKLDRVQNDTFFNDVAFTRLPPPIITPYSSMPWRHFKGKESELLDKNLYVGLFNMANQDLNVSPSSVVLRELNSNVNLFGTTLTLLNGQEANVENIVPVNRTYPLDAFPNPANAIFGDYFQVMAGPAFDPFERLEFKMDYTLSNTTQIMQPGFGAVQRNDAVSHTTVFDDYFAYDDGTAEGALVTSTGSQVAVKFSTQVPDTLRAVRIHFPRTSINAEEQVFRLRVFIGQLDGSPEYQRNFLPLYTDAIFDTLQGFTTYQLVDINGEPTPLPLPPGDFYVGWQQLSNCSFVQCVPVGYDRNRPEAKDQIFRNSGTGWEPLAASTQGGALMIRPVVGSQTPDATTAAQAQQDRPAAFRIYPNPSSGLLNIWSAAELYEAHQFQLFSTTGQLMAQGTLSPQVDAQHLPSGLYLLKITDRNGQQKLMQRIVLAK